MAVFTSPKLLGFILTSLLIAPGALAKPTGIGKQVFPPSNVDSEVHPNADTWSPPFAHHTSTHMGCYEVHNGQDVAWVSNPNDVKSKKGRWYYTPNYEKPVYECDAFDANIFHHTG